MALEGEIESILDLGEVRGLKHGSLISQRGTCHQRRNAGKMTWARMQFVVHEAKPLEVVEKTK